MFLPLTLAILCTPCLSVGLLQALLDGILQRLGDFTRSASPGIHVIDLGLSTTPTVEVAVPMEHADGGIILTASHNPKQWNALKLLNHKGEFLNGAEGQKILDIAEGANITFAEVDDLGDLGATFEWA